jgi:hypothetical protein
MKTFRKLASVVCTTGTLLLASAASATPVAFNITAVAFATPGGGYGVDVDEKTGTLLDVRFNTGTFAPQNFELSTVHPFTTFTFGTIAMFESDAQGGITIAEQDGLGVTATFTFVSPVGTPQTLTATGIATLGSVSDTGVDFTIDWGTPISVAFGSGGLFELSLNPLGFTDNGTGAVAGQTQTLTATVRLIRESGTPNGTPIPEPSTVALFGLGLLGAAFTRRKAARAQ